MSFMTKEEQPTTRPIKSPGPQKSLPVECSKGHRWPIEFWSAAHECSKCLRELLDETEANLENTLRELKQLRTNYFATRHGD